MGDGNGPAGGVRLERAASPFQPEERIPPAPSYAELTGQALSLTGEVLAWRAHATDDCAALARVWKLAQVWDAAAGSDPSPWAVARRNLAAQVRRAITDDGGPA